MSSVVRRSNFNPPNAAGTENKHGKNHLVVMRGGRIAAQGDPVQILTADLLQEVFGLDADMVAYPRTGIPMVVPRGQKARTQD